MSNPKNFGSVLKTVGSLISHLSKLPTFVLRHQKVLERNTHHQVDHNSSFDGLDLLVDTFYLSFGNRYFDTHSTNCHLKYKDFLFWRYPQEIFIICIYFLFIVFYVFTKQYFNCYAYARMYSIELLLSVTQNNIKVL